MGTVVPWICRFRSKYIPWIDASRGSSSPANPKPQTLNPYLQFKQTIGGLVQLTKCDNDRALLLVNDTNDMLNRSLSRLDMVESSPGAFRF
jgi:hypothetical protein